MKSARALFLLAMLFNGSAYAKEWPFTVYLDDKEIGRHTFVLTEHDGKRELVSNAKLDVKILFIDAYSYVHTATEKWQGDCLTSLTASTDDNGEITAIKGKLEDRGFALDTAKGKKTLPACIMTFAYWNPDFLTQNKLLDPQTGEWQDVKIKSLGNENLEVRGQQVPAEHFNIDSPKLKIDVWYSPDKEWLALKSTTPEGYVISYKLR